MKPPVGDAGGLGPAPDVVRALFASGRLPLLQRYAELLATDGVVRGLIGPREVPRLWDRHLVNCGLLALAVPEGATVADIGSGAGLPGLVLALARPDAQVTLVEPLLRRTTFLEEVVAELGLVNVEVRRDRADALHGTATYDVVTARAVAGLEKLAGWCLPLVAPTGALVAMKGDSAEQEIAEAWPVLKKRGCARPVVEDLHSPALEGLDAGAATMRVVRVTWADPSRVSLPTSGGPARRRRRPH
ncbi:16S rRNA (guanine(527)-N(7))-methyltransferase RsmG [Nocardioides stalactiti]|uniref:16S rRNA (guanine(527)-N(7))-methyltransferase RsmG n=1 Tax=Nocardioides stalactiti TaxID=2755356 RepID=UPI0016014F0C|nr:16S rRNA (guanine(527)-N(7))-methyltransferase RsmG [Nocardioides stalactiti]